MSVDLGDDPDGDLDGYDGYDGPPLPPGQSGPGVPSTRIDAVCDRVDCGAGSTPCWCGWPGSTAADEEA